MARNKTKSDEVYNARRRLTRKANSLVNKAKATSGIAKARLESQARNLVERAISTYKGNSKIGGILANLSNALGVNPFDIQTSTNLDKDIEASYKALTFNPASYRNVQAQNILTGNVASRFYGGLVEIWGVDRYSREHPVEAILNYFGTNDMMDVIEMIEEAGINLYEPVENETQYDSISLKIQELVLSKRNGK